MKRFLYSLQWEVVRQYRYGFYFVSGAIILINAGILSRIPKTALPLLIPAFLVTGLIATTFYFMSGMVLLEKSEHVLEGLVVTPLRGTEFLAAKITALTLLGALESMVVVIAIFGPGFQWLFLLGGLIAISIVYSAVGFIAIARYDSINEFMLPSVGITMLLSLPLIDHFGVWHSPVMLLHPIQPALVLMRAAFQSAQPWEVVYGLVGSAAWAGVGLVLARRSFTRFVVRTAGSSL